jgi:hypothetical protein
MGRPPNRRLREAGEQDDEATDQVDPSPGGGVEMQEVDVAGRFGPGCRDDAVELVLDDPRQPAMAWKTPIMISMIAANVIQPTAAVLLSSGMVCLARLSRFSHRATRLHRFDRSELDRIITQIV